MKELLKKWMFTSYRLFKKHTILKLAGVGVIIYLLHMGITWLPTLQIKYMSPPDVGLEELAASKGEIPIGEAETLVAETDTKKLYIDSTTLNLKVEDKVSGKTWNSVRPEGNEDEKSLIRITYSGEDNTELTWNSFIYSLQNKTYSIEKIENGVRVNLNMKVVDSYLLEEYMPKKITIEKFETTFIKGLDDKFAEGAITDAELQKYKTALSLIYVKDEANNCYYNRYSSAPPISVVTQLIEVTKIINYSTEQLMEDNSDFGITVTLVQPADFVIPLEATLDGEDFVVRVPTDQIDTKNKYYEITRIEVLPYFGAVSPAEAEDGYIFVPDGAGALFELNKFNSNFGSYTRELYSNTFYNSFYYMSSFPESLHMPVFGMTYGKDDNSTGGFMGIIEKGDETAYITATLASTEEGGGSSYNKVHSSFDSAQFAQVSILGPYDSGGGRFMASTGLMDINYTVRYKLFNDKVTYYDMAMTYRNYLVDRYDLTLKYDEKAKLYLDVTGTLTLEERILGIVYNKALSMTTYKELQDILTDLKEIPLVINYMGVFNDGIQSKVMNRADLTGANGSRQQLKDLMSYIESNQQELFLQTDFSRVYEKGNGFKTSIHGMYNFDNYPVYIYGYAYNSGILSSLTPNYNVLNPAYLTSVINGFLKGADEYKNLYIGDLASGYFANYGKNKIVSPAEAQAIINQNLDKITETKTLSLNNPEINKIIYGKYATNISRESSGYSTFSVEIPFRQLVMNGLIAYTTLNINETAVSTDYFLLQALELGSYPKYTITAKSLDLIKNSVHSDFISRQYSLIGKDMKEFYKEYETAYAKVNSMEISNHKVLADKVYETTYANGVRVITNYNKYPVEIDGQEIGALGYLIIQ
ncbi:MAG: hypothetical protein K0S76_849 [Herbinix sp.]|nr:hypothetical protein [Herbinix sp.]